MENTEIENTELNIKELFFCRDYINDEGIEIRELVDENDLIL